jgi:hypothetical protein
VPSNLVCFAQYAVKLSHGIEELLRPIFTLSLVLWAQSVKICITMDDCYNSAKCDGRIAEARLVGRLQYTNESFG